MRNIFICFIFLKTAFASNLNNLQIKELEIEYKVTHGNICLPDTNRFQFFFGVTISQCVTECGARGHCKALTYKGKINVCELFLTSNTDNSSSGDCLYVTKDDINMKKVIYIDSSEKCEHFTFNY